MKKLPYILISLIICIYVGLLFYVNAKTEFTVENWVQADDVSRYRMARYLETEKLLIGKHKSEIINILGPPSFSDKNYLFYKVDEPLGDKDGFSINLSMGFVTSAYTHD